MIENETWNQQTQTRKQNLQANSRSACQFWHKREKEAQRLFTKLHIHSISTQRGRNRAYFGSTTSNLRDSGRFSKLPYFGMKLCHSQKFQKVHSLSTRGGGEIEFIFALRRVVSEIWGDFAKLPYLSMKPDHWQKFQKLHIHSLSTP